VAHRRYLREAQRGATRRYASICGPAQAGTRSRARASPTPSRSRPLGRAESREDTTATRRSAAKSSQHLLVDTEGLMLKARVHSAKVPDQDGLRLLLQSARTGLSRLKHLWLDAGYEGRSRRWAKEAMGLSVEIVRKPQKPVPEEVAKVGPRNGSRRARRSTGRGSCRREGTWLCLGGGWWRGPSRGWARTGG
jgi:Transposase DDE domain